MAVPEQSRLFPTQHIRVQVPNVAVAQSSSLSPRPSARLCVRVSVVSCKRARHAQNSINKMISVKAKRSVHRTSPSSSSSNKDDRVAANGHTRYPLPAALCLTLPLLKTVLHSSVSTYKAISHAFSSAQNEISESAQKFVFFTFFFCAHRSLFSALSAQFSSN